MAKTARTKNKRVCAIKKFVGDLDYCNMSDEDVLCNVCDCLLSTRENQGTRSKRNPSKLKRTSKM